MAAFRTAKVVAVPIGKALLFPLETCKARVRAEPRSSLGQRSITLHTLFPAQIAGRQF
jgi:hypothetical protein